MLFYCVARLLRDSSVKNKLITAGAVYLSVVSGMPESTFLMVVYAWAYFAWRVATAQDLRQLAANKFAALAQSSVLGFALSVFLPIPFLEFLRNGYDLHRADVSGIAGGFLQIGFTARVLLPYLAPLVAGPISGFLPGLTGAVQVWGYFGVTAAALSILGVLHAARNWRSFGPRADVALTAFFFLSAVVFFLKHYGHWSVNWIAALPLFDLVYYPKYLQPLIGFSVGTLTGLGAGYVFSGRARRAEIFGTLLLLLISIFAMASGYWPLVIPATQWSFMFYVNLLVAISVLLLLSFLLSCCGTRDLAHSRVARFGRYAVICTLAVELCGDYVVPLYHVFSRPTPATFDPYQGGPYVRFLQDHTRDFSRVFGREGYLYPNWASAFQISDVRYYHAITWNKYFDFLHTFLGPKPADPGNGFPASGELAARSQVTNVPTSF